MTNIIKRVEKKVKIRKNQTWLIQYTKPLKWTVREKIFQKAKIIGKKNHTLFTVNVGVLVLILKLKGQTDYSLKL